MNGKHPRREFLQHTAAAFGAAVLSAETVATDSAARTTTVAPMIPIVDTHQHLWDLKKFKLPWITADSPLARDYLPADYAQATVGLGIVQSIYMEVDVEPSQQLEEAKYVAELCRRADSTLTAAVVSGRPNSSGFRDYLDMLKEIPQVKGLRQVLHGGQTPRGYCLSKEFVAGIRLLGQRGLSFDLCIRPEEISDATKLAQACPETQFILDHCGNVRATSKDRSTWEREIAELARCQNVAGKVSGQIDKAPTNWSAADLTPIVNHVCQVFGPDRVVFGSDWPVCTLGGTLQRWVEALRSIVQNRNLEEQRKLFHENARRIYRLKPA